MIRFPWPFMAHQTVIPATQDTGPSPMYSDVPVPPSWASQACSLNCEQGRKCSCRAPLTPCPKPPQA